MACGTNGATGLTAWDNAQAALVVGELKAVDWPISWNVIHTKPFTQSINPLTASHYQKRISVGRNEGSFVSDHYVQTGILAYNVMGACTTAGVGDPYTHTITKSTATTPTRLAFHMEKEGGSAQRRKDVMGFVPRSLDISVSEKDTVARQTFIGAFAFTGAGANLAAPAELSQSALRPFTWFDYKSASGASAFTYNTGAINVDIVSVNLHIAWSEAFMGIYDANGYYTNGLVVPPFVPEVKLGLRLTDYTDTQLDTISDLVHTSYAGDLDYICDFYESANRYLKFTFDKMYVDPAYEEVFQEEGSWYNGVEITLKLKDETSSLTVEEKNSLTKVYYEHD